ncbi:hypothetical protein DYB32_008673 [Aphanomyces invadans]|uniref:Apple domain-containing protein n=1 Tax=Aphanomyces invadans TaxID=157072 RepID=A0A3R6WGF2_9STRA|nr:hypothetical protein DYB32_008673 [Aphanomyces invadans]
MKVALLSTIAAVAAAQSTCPGLEYNVDYEGSDITYTDRATAAECTADCASTPGCKLFVWYQNQCWLKSFQGEKKSLPDRTSCVLSAPVTPTTPMCAGLEYNVDYEGNNIGSTARNSANECIADCVNTPGCNTFVWFWNTCWLKSKAANKQYLQDRIACALTTPGPQPTLVCPGVYYNVDYEGHDIAFTTRQSADECTADCQSTPGCKLFVWFEGQCWLKSSKGATRYLPGRNSCVLERSTPSTATCPGLEYNVDYAGYDISYTDRNSAAECTADCQKTLGCKAFVWYQNQCWLKNQLGERKELSDRIACVLNDSNAVTTTTSAPVMTTSTAAPITPVTTTNLPDFQSDDDATTQQPAAIATTTTPAAPATTTTTSAPRPTESVKPLETGPRGTAAPAGTLEPWDSQGTPEPTTDGPDYDDYTDPPATTAAPTTTTLKPLETGPRGTAAPAGTLEPWDSQGTPEPTTDLPDPDDYLDDAVSNRAIVSNAQVGDAAHANTHAMLALGLVGIVLVALVVVMKRPAAPTPTLERKRLLQV